MIFTKHAQERSKERLGLNKNAAERLALIALEKGVKHSETTGSLNKFITALYFKTKTANNSRLYADKVFIFNNETLITVFELPNKFKAVLKKIKDQKQC